MEIKDQVGLTFKPMEISMAKQIASWQYPEPYYNYSMDGSDECLNELINGDYYVAFDSTGEIYGYICTGHSARVPGGYTIGLYEDHSYVDFGLGLRPNLTGKGNGTNFTSEGLQFLSQTQQIKRFRLVVASFNLRAIKVYEAIGFTPIVTFMSYANGVGNEFICMTYQEVGSLEA